jgi:hypothetical protein
MTRILTRLPRHRRLATVLLVALASLWSLTTAFGHYSYVRSPLQRNTTVSSTWSHGYSYGERALDLQSSGESVFSYMENPNTTDYLYYEVSNYVVNSGDCPGSKFLLFIHTPGGQYYYYGRINYVHLTDHSGKWGRSWNINPGQAESDLYVGYTAATCGAGVHLHTGHTDGDGMLEQIAGNVNDTVYQGSLLMYH